MPAEIQSFVGKHVHFIGIGGSSMSGLAHYVQQMGCIVTGSDRVRSHKTDALIASGIPVFIGHAAEQIGDAALIVYSAAIADDNPERVEAARQGVSALERCDLLGQLMQGQSAAIGVSGTHGKTTTTAMLAQVLIEAGEDPSVHIGGELPAMGGSTRKGQGDTFLFEACEFRRSFLHFFPTVALILNIDEDHLDCYRDLDDIEDAFRQYAERVPSDGWVIGCGDDRRVRHVLESLACHTRTYGLGAHNEICAEQVSYDENGCAYAIATLFGHPLMEIQLRVPGQHNLLNALAVIATAVARQLPLSQVAESLSRFAGVHRRFEQTGVIDGVRLYHDYGHNPAEIKNALTVARIQAKQKLWSVWQPHTYSRTRTLFDQFITTFDVADEVLITQICGAREVDPGDISSDMFIEPLRARGVKAVVTPTFDDAEAYLRAHWTAGDLVITHGCGDVDLLNEQIQQHGNTKPSYS